MRTRRSVRPVPALAGLLLAAALALTGCGGADDSAGSGADKAVSDAAGGQGAAGAGSGRGAEGAGGAKGSGATAPAALAPEHVIRTASLTVRVAEVPKALAEARTAAEDAGGHVGRETTGRDEEGHERTEVVLRVPGGSYDEVLAALSGTGELLERSTKAEDVTDQVVDVESRIASQRASVARVRELMERAERLTDVVTLEGELSSRQAELESLLARQASLEDRTALATITLTLTETPPPADGGDDDPGFTDALAGGWHAFVTMLRWLAVVLGAVLPFAAVAVLLVLGWTRLVRPRLPRRPVPAPVPVPSAPGPLPSARPAPQPARPDEHPEG
ncbi:DUF4349 domain-containing protein [Streptomyces griseoviridis]|uniref:Lipoprotein n=1 Tax=Streptomyces griseoviridis TaxID=45398 RepID=A0A918GLK3_STRGD|nr:DUF4349 domain-containing protein [Streptomyces niveoruber]GGS44936.1 lipoprotein [Streptomyces niveoruber]